MDPFSVIVGTVGLLDVCTRLIIYLKDIKGSVARIDKEIEALSKDVAAVKLVTEFIDTTIKAKKERINENPDASQGNARKLWENATTILAGVTEGCQDTLTKLSTVIREMKGKGLGPRAFEDFMHVLRNQSRHEEYRQLRSDLNNSLTTLQLMLNTIQLLGIQDSPSPDKQLFVHIRKLSLTLEGLPARLKASHNLFNAAQKSAEDVLTSVSGNKHFDIPQTVSSIFTGREAQLKELQTTFFAPSSDVETRNQKRFVIYGVAGSGKTQFCCKFAQEYRKHFWGVFWINATSDERATQTFSRLAKQFGGREPNERAAKNWLSQLELPWLLIIDNVDDSSTDVGTLFPGGERGSVLITTRNPAHKVHGTVGSQYFDFGQLEGAPAADLLLKAAGRPNPWDPPTKSLALNISTVLGALPLALVYAGKAIVEGLCTLQDYVKYYTSSWQRINQALSDSGSDPDQELYLSIYSTYEMVYLALKDKKGEAAADALQLLNMFAFLNNEHIRWDMLTQAAKNPSLERQTEESGHTASNLNSKSKPWAKVIKEKGTELIGYFVLDRGPPVLPDVLRDSEARPFDEFRLRKALTELSQRSMIIHNEATDSYFMHPVVHTWVRERPEMMRKRSIKTQRRSDLAEDIPEMTRAQPEMRVGRQALWCQAAATVLSQAILLPPLGMQAADEDLRRDLLPHIEHVQERQVEIRDRISIKQRSKWLWAMQPQLSRREVLQMAKYSLVFLQAGRWKEAEELQTTVRDFVCAVRGVDHPVSIRIQLALSENYWQQGRGLEAADLQEKVLEACLMSLGPEDQKTLQVMNALAASYWLQGRYKPALELLETALGAYIKTVGPDHEDTLRTYDNLGRIHLKYWRYDKAKDLHSRALEGMKKSKALGLKHRDTLSAMENLAMTYFTIGGSLLEPAEAMINWVIKQRTERLGREHPYTLWARLNHARIRGARGYHSEAEEEIRAGLEVAERNLGDKHIGILQARARLGQLLVRQGNWTEAEEVLHDVIEKLKRMPTARMEEHPDRLLAEFYLVHCYWLQNKVEDAAILCARIIGGLTYIGGEKHPFMEHLVQTQEALKNPEKMTGSLRTTWMVL
ncbi:MAG: hypothetical protein FRX48_02370 [Lasallia pustulata]|uniref:NB-ARC domain-containing protein n=1 Tax=Lasallia pustulata TaxID=136370 RepID=A0A5M8PZB1_9LECA|nr:MAG: hypothetical protein FRX48_02370 [Lasallia pustulata]